MCVCVCVCVCVMCVCVVNVGAMIIFSYYGQQKGKVISVLLLGPNTGKGGNQSQP